MDEIICIGKRENGSWIAIGYDIRYKYGYETMLLLLDKFISEYDIKVGLVTKSPIAGANRITVWRKLFFNKPKPLSDMEALKEECGDVSVGGISKRLSDIQLYVTLTNQTSIIVFQVINSFEISNTGSTNLDTKGKKTYGFPFRVHYLAGSRGF